MKELTTEDLKLIADEMGKKLTKLISSEQIEYFISDNSGDLILWNPVESTDQCLEVLEWLIDQKGKKRIDLKEIFIGLSEYYYQFYDFKLAVCLAAVEWIKQSKR